MTNEKLTGIVDELRVIRTANKKEIAFFNLSGKKMIAFPNAYHKFNKIIKDGANLIIYADRNKEPGRNEYFVRDCYLPCFQRR